MQWFLVVGINTPFLIWNNNVSKIWFSRCLTLCIINLSTVIRRLTHTRAHSSRYSSPSLRSSAPFHTGNLGCFLPQDSTSDWQQAGYQNPRDASPPSGQNTALHINIVKILLLQRSSNGWYVSGIPFSRRQHERDLTCLPFTKVLWRNT